jgi:hypothetical protein
MVSANIFDCHSPAPVQKPVQVQGSTSKEYGEDSGAVSRNWEYGRQEKRREQATCSLTPNTVGTIHASVASSPARKSVRQLASENEVTPSTAWRILRTNLCMHPYKILVFQSLATVCREKWIRFAEESGDHLQRNPLTLEHIWF